MMTMKNKLKQSFPFIYFVYQQYNYNKMLHNIYNTAYKKNALLSYITIPFKKTSNKHTNYFEAQTLASILMELGYNVDVIHYQCSRDRDLAKYNLICGFGNIFQKYFESNYSNIKTFYYGTGMHPYFQNSATLNRVKNVYQKKGKWLGKSARFVESSWTHQTSLVDGILALGNEVCTDSYRKYYAGKIFSIPGPYYKVQNARAIIDDKYDGYRTHFLWFGSAGLIHKGLDLLLEYFALHNDLTLHICGLVENEPAFVKVYKQELYNTKNIINHGFIDINSNIFVEILKSCAFTVLPSCSEGGSPSVLTTVGNGGLIPIISKWTTISTGCEITIDSLDHIGINKAIEKAMNLTDTEIKQMQIENLNYVEEFHSQAKYVDSLKSSISKILETTHGL